MFESDKAVGEAWESEFMQWVHDNYPSHSLTKRKGYFRAFDLECSHCDLKIECKNDEASHKYDGNVLLEYAPLEYTAADWFVLKTAIGVFIFDPRSMKQIIDKDLGLGKQENKDFGDIRGFWNRDSNPKYNVVFKPGWFLYRLNQTGGRQIMESINEH